VRDENGEYIQGDGELYFSGNQSFLEENLDKLPEVPCSRDMQIVIEGEGFTTNSYTLYNDQYERERTLYNLSLLAEEGECILGIDVTWSRGITDEYYRCESFFIIKP